MTGVRLTASERARIAERTYGMGLVGTLLNA